MLNKINRKLWLTVLAHILGWLLFFTFPFFKQEGNNFRLPPLERRDIDSSIPENYIRNFQHIKSNNAGLQPTFRHRQDEIIRMATITNVLLLICFYLNLAFFKPDITNTKHILKYILSQVGLLILFFEINKYLIKIIIGNFPLIPFGFISLNYVVIATVALCLNLIKDGQQKERLAKEKQNAALLTELLFLRWQMSPHFLFNVLNNMVSLARNKSDRLENMIIDLSNLMRYMLYETDDEKVTIEKELTYIESYIALQKQRFGSDVNIQLNSLSITHPELEIEPMLLIPFIENAFKHGTSHIDNPYIYIDIKCEQKRLRMIVRNNYKPDISLTKDPTKGIGLSNVKRRLELLYTNKYSLAVKREENIYSVTLEIRLS